MPQERYLPEGMLIKTEKNIERTSSLSAIKDAMRKGDIIEGHAVLCDSSHNLIVETGGFSGVIPRGEAAMGIDSGGTRDIAVISRVGRAVAFKIAGIDETGEKPMLILSRRAAQEETLDYYMDQAENGDIIRAKITHLEPFGAFVDVGCGVISLVSIENISVSRISHPSERFFPGQDILAVIASKDRNMRRINLTHKELLGTWSENAQAFQQGETVRGIVRGIEEYGIFVELAPNLSGLAENRKGVKVGDTVSVYIKSIIPEKMKIKLIIIGVIEDGAKRHNGKYFITDGRIESFTYTPRECKTRVIQTIFK